MSYSSTHHGAIHPMCRATDASTQAVADDTTTQDDLIDQAYREGFAEGMAEAAREATYETMRKATA